MRERLAEFVQFRRRAVQLDAREVCHLQHFSDLRADIIEVRQHAFGIRVCLTTEDLISVQSESIVEILGFTLGLLHESRQQSPDIGESAMMRSEVGMQADDCAVGHSRTLSKRAKMARQSPAEVTEHWDGKSGAPPVAVCSRIIH